MGNLEREDLGNGFFTRTGALTGAYSFNTATSDIGTVFSEMALAERLEWARKGASLVQPEFGDPDIVPTDKGLSIAWNNVPFQRGGWASWRRTPEDTARYTRLRKGALGRFYIIGDQMSTLSGWMEGAIMSAHYAIERVARRPEPDDGFVQLVDTDLLVGA